MAFEPPSEPHPCALSAQTTGALREAVVCHLERRADGEAKLNSAVAAVVAEARERAMRPEALILAFKNLYDALPEPTSAVARAEQMQLRERLVSACIRAYFRVEG